MNPSLIAVAISDLHLSLLRPACRADKDWLEVQAHYLRQVKDTARNVPVLCSGDIFDRWNPPPELINFALRELPDGMLCVPGQHDLPSHRIEDMHRSGYGVLKEAGKITDLSNSNDFSSNWTDDRLQDGGDLYIVGFGWEEEIVPAIQTHALQIAVIHRYFWIDGKSYPGATEDSRLRSFKKQLGGYDIAVTGDNHKKWIALCGDCTVVNVGGFIRRKSDEINRKPAMALLFSDGTVKWKLLDTSIDKFQDNIEERPESALDMQDFIRKLNELGESGLNFKEVVKQKLRSGEISPEACQMIKEALEANANQ